MIPSDEPTEEEEVEQKVNIILLSGCCKRD